MEWIQISHSVFLWVLVSSARKKMSSNFWVHRHFKATLNNFGASVNPSVNLPVASTLFCASLPKLSTRLSGFSSKVNSWCTFSSSCPDKAFLTSKGIENILVLKFKITLWILLMRLFLLQIILLILNYSFFILQIGPQTFHILLNNFESSWIS